MNLEHASKVHRYALIALAVFFTLGCVRASFYDGESGAAAAVWVLGLSLYLPIHVLHAEFKGTIHLPSNVDFEKEGELLGFRFVQAVYLVLSVAMFVAALRDLT